MHNWSVLSLSLLRLSSGATENPTNVVHSLIFLKMEERTKSIQSEQLIEQTRHGTADPQKRNICKSAPQLQCMVAGSRQLSKQSICPPTLTKNAASNHSQKNSHDNNASCQSIPINHRKQSQQTTNQCLQWPSSCALDGSALRAKSAPTTDEWKAWAQ